MQVWHGKFFWHFLKLQKSCYGSTPKILFPIERINLVRTAQYFICQTGPPLSMNQRSRLPIGSLSLMTPTTQPFARVKSSCWVAVTFCVTTYSWDAEYVAYMWAFSTAVWLPSATSSHCQQSINQSINEMNESINQSMNQSINQPVLLLNNICYMCCANINK